MRSTLLAAVALALGLSIASELKAGPSTFSISTELQLPSDNPYFGNRLSLTPAANLTYTLTPATNRY